MAKRFAAGVSAWAAHLAFASVAALVLASAGQPLQTDDAWWHLALGRAYASEGPWLAGDPLLHSAQAAPQPAAWLADLGLFALGEAAGFTGLRLAHAGLVAAVLALAWSLLKRASGSRAAASLATAAFAALSAYRLFQLRPELFTILAALGLYRLLLERLEPASGRRIAASVALVGVWANLHGGFLLGPILVAAALGGLALAAALAPPRTRARDLARARRLALALGLGLAASLANPGGVAPHLAWFHAGAQTPELTLVRDEWARLDPLSLPVANLPPSPLAWGLVWLLLLLTPPLAFRAARAWRGGGSERPDADPVLVLLAGASLAAMLLAVRFLWLGLFPMLLFARFASPRLRERRIPRPAAALAVAAAAVLLVAGFVRRGDWPMISGTLPTSLAGYAQPFTPAKYEARPVWLLADAGLRGSLFNEYFMGGFLGYWLAPETRAFVNGSLNLPREALAAHAALAWRRGLAGESFLELLDRYGVDLFLGIGVPQTPRSNRPLFYSTAHLEGAPGWIQVFRTPETALYLRSNSRNRENLERLLRHYAREGVPFDGVRGFDPAAVIREAPAWAEAHGLVPVDFASLEADASGDDPRRKRWALERLAALWLALGCYDRAIELDRQILRSNPLASAPTRRVVWSLLRLGRNAEAAEAARPLLRRSDDPLGTRVANVARRATSSDADETAALLARLPALSRAEASRAVAGIAPPPARPWR